MKKHALLFLSLFSFTLMIAQSGPCKYANICIDPTHEEGRINKHVYGFLLEHLYHSVSNGIWGENVWNRSFEELLAEGNWSADTQGCLTINAQSITTGSRFNIGRIKDGCISLDVRRRSGHGSILIGLRDQQRENLKTNSILFHLGGYDDNKHTIECRTGWIWHTPIAQLTTHMAESKNFGQSFCTMNQCEMPAVF